MIIYLKIKNKKMNNNKQKNKKINNKPELKIKQIIHQKNLIVHLEIYPLQGLIKNLK